MSEADRDEPETSCSEWYGDGSAGKDDRASSLAAMVSARAVREASGARGRSVAENGPDAAGGGQAVAEEAVDRAQMISRWTTG